VFSDIRGADEPRTDNLVGDPGGSIEQVGRRFSASPPQVR